ncbi:hypothetical protein KIL84_010503 [Mauremys mutica]|uniref:Uncharacterized protein n=1 Tax=Mauremys mutica TaxID=74926 RepID=A0A9D3XBY8_9SAUR|nr:hypothetical protein KIL84_010503 [Mauremys mutica]
MHLKLAFLKLLEANILLPHTVNIPECMFICSYNMKSGLKIKPNRSCTVCVSDKYMGSIYLGTKDLKLESSGNSATTFVWKQIVRVCGSQRTGQRFVYFVFFKYKQWLLK